MDEEKEKKEKKKDAKNNETETFKLEHGYEHGHRVSHRNIYDLKIIDAFKMPPQSEVMGDYKIGRILL